VGSEKTVNVAIFIDSEKMSGGGYRYEYTVLKILQNLHNQNDIVFKYYSFRSKSKTDYKDIKIQISTLKENIFRKIHTRILLNRYIYI